MTSYPTPFLCFWCTRRRQDPDVAGITAETCDAYPTKIPDAIVDNQVDHRLPYPGDRGLQFAPGPDWEGRGKSIMSRYLPDPD